MEELRTHEAGENSMNTDENWLKVESRVD